MVKLIVEEGGGRRAFRMGKGVLTVGSGAEARLRLSSTDVAEVHLELELGEEGVRLRPRPGVVPPRVGGKEAKGEQVLAIGARLEVGAARLWLEAEEGEAVPASAPAAPKTASAPRPPRSRRPERGAPAGRMPGWLVPVLFLAATGVAFLLWFRSVKHEAGEGEGMAMNKLRAAEQAAETADFASALRELAEIPATAMTPEQSARKEAMQRDFLARQAEVETSVANLSGTKYLDAMLKKYEAAYLQGEPDHAKARLFLKRCRVFRERWPTHPETDWVRRQEARFAGYVNLALPPTWEDVQWEVKDLTEGAPRNYVAALGLLDELLSRVSGEEHTKAENLRGEVVAGRPDYAEDKLYQAKHEFEKKGDPSKAVWWLVHNIAWLGDEALANENARVLVKMPDLAGHLLGYKQAYPDRYEAVMKNPIVASWAEEAGFEP